MFLADNKAWTICFVFAATDRHHAVLAVAE